MLNNIRLTVGIVDYGAGNHTSVLRCVRQLGYRARISSLPDQLDQADVLLLPGVGAFPKAMYSLHAAGLVNYLRHAAQLSRPLIGICFISVIDWLWRLRRWSIMVFGTVRKWTH